jgi:signal transduction histidine kinase
MKFKVFKSERTRLILTLELAVVLPAAALVFLGAMHLRSIQRNRDVEAAIQRDFYQVLAISEKQINQRAYDLVDDARSDIPGPDQLCAASLDKLLVSHPYLAHAFTFDPDHGLTFRSQPYRSTEPGFQLESSDLSGMVGSWVRSDLEYKSWVEEIERANQHGMNYVFFMNSAPRGGKTMMSQPVAVFLADSGSGKKAVVGFAFDAEYIRDKFLPEMLDKVMARNLAESGQEKNPAVMMIHSYSDATPIAASAGWDGGDAEIERKLEGAMRGFTLAIKLRGTTLKAIGDRFVRTSFLTLGALALVLAGGLVLTHRNVAKEMALARLKSDFVSNVSHELRTPLSLIRLYAETLEMGRINSPEKTQEYYQIIRKESERLTALINNILDFSRIEAGRKEYDFRDTDLGELVRTTLDSYRYQIEQSGFKFEEKIAIDLPPMKVDREAMARSVLNLVNNSLKYSQDSRYIGVNLFRDNGSVRLEVIDHGIGIARIEQEKIFDKFYRVGDPLVHNTKGSGLGLSLVRHIVQAHGGEVLVDSAPGQGSKFTIALPVVPKRGEAVLQEHS